MCLENSGLVITAQPEHLEDLLNMALDLWPDYTQQDLRTTLLEILNSEKFTVFLYRLQHEFLGFVYLSIRTDYVEGSDTSPTGYVEGIYVKPDFRRQGISRKLLRAGEQWVKEKGCTQLGSDIHITNTISYNFHTSLGFTEAARLIAFIKDLQ